MFENGGFGRKKGRYLNTAKFFSNKVFRSSGKGVLTKHGREGGLNQCGDLVL